MDREEQRMCRPGGLSLTEEMLRLADIAKGEPLKVLDVGCGEGATVRYLRKLHPAWNVMGIDVNPGFREEGMITTGAAEKLPYPDGSIDLLLMECSFSKTEDPKRALEEAFRVLSPDGCLLMSDMYARKRELCAHGLLGRLEFSNRIWKRLTDAGFSVTEMRDASGALAQWVGQQIMDGKEEMLCGALGAGRRELKEAGCGYFICAARPSALWRTLSYARERSAFYRELWNGRGDVRPGDWEAFRALPFTEPEDVKENPERFLCVPAKEIARIITLKTSGSSGKPKRLFFTADDLLLTADFFEKGMQYMVKMGDRVTVYMEGPGLFSVGGLLKEGLGRIGVDVTVHGLIRDMDAAARDGEGRECLVGVPGQMYSLAVRAPHLRPESVLLSADYVPKSVKLFLEHTWKCKAFTHWGMTETGYGGGVQCGAREGYHMRDRDLLLEIIDPETGKLVLDGEYGEVVLTTLRRRGMPLIRYRTGDIGRWLTKPCPCGCLKPRLSEVEGRYCDVIRLPEGKLLSIHMLDEMLLSSGRIEDFSAAYDREKCHLSLAVMAHGASGGAVSEAERCLKRQFGESIKISVESREISPYIGSGKRRIEILS